MATVENRNSNKLSKQDQNLRKKLIAAGIPATGLRVKPDYSKLPIDAEYHSNKDSASVVFLGNNPEYADQGGDFCSMVSIVAGVKGQALKNDKFVKSYSDLKNDAAAIHVVQRGDPQKQLNLASPARNPDDDPIEYKALSHVTALADTVQLVARTGGVNLYAGGESFGNLGSTGFKNDPPWIGVNLIYGNKIVDDPSSPYSLQPLVKGASFVKILNRKHKNERNQLSVQFKQEVSSLSNLITTQLVVAIMTLNIPQIIKIIAEIIWSILTLIGIIFGYINTVITEVNSSAITSDSILSSWNKTN